MIIVWDESKRQANLAKHGIDFADIDPEFFLAAQVVPAKEGRWAAIGYLEGAIVVIFFGAGHRGDFDHLGQASKPQRKKHLTMTASKFTPTDLAAVSDNPELTDQALAQAKPFAEVFPTLAAKLEIEHRLRGRPKSLAPKVSTTLRLDPDIVAHFRSTGPGWQSRINDALRHAAKLEAS